MASLDSVTVAEIPQGGEWIAPGGECDDIEFLTVGITDAYIDAQSRAHKRLALAHGGELDRVPVGLLRKESIKCLFRHSVFGIRGLTHQGAEVPWETVQALAHEPRYRPLIDGAFAAARLAQARRKVDIEQAEGNFVPPSGSTSNGPDMAT